MNPILKKLLLAVALKQGVDRLQEMRRPKKPALLARWRTPALVLVGGAGAVYLARSGRVNALLGRTPPQGATTYGPGDVADIAPEHRPESVGG